MEWQELKKQKRQGSSPVARRVKDPIATAVAQVATAVQIRSLAQELPQAMSVAKKTPQIQTKNPNPQIKQQDWMGI